MHTKIALALTIGFASLAHSRGDLEEDVLKLSERVNLAIQQNVEALNRRDLEELRGTLLQMLERVDRVSIDLVPLLRSGIQNLAMAGSQVLTRVLSRELGKSRYPELLDAGRHCNHGGMMGGSVCWTQVALQWPQDKYLVSEGEAARTIHAICSRSRSMIASCYTTMTLGIPAFRTRVNNCMMVFESGAARRCYEEALLGPSPRRR